MPTHFTIVRVEGDYEIVQGIFDMETFSLEFFSGWVLVFKVPEKDAVNAKPVPVKAWSCDHIEIKWGTPGELEAV